MIDATAVFLTVLYSWMSEREIALRAVYTVKMSNTYLRFT